MKTPMRITLLAFALIALCVSACASLVPSGLYISREQSASGSVDPIIQAADRYAIMVGECREVSTEYYEYENGFDGIDGSVSISASFQPVWYSEKDSLSYSDKPVSVRSMVLTQEGSSPFEAGKQYALFGRLTNSESDPVQFTVGKTVQKFSSSLTRERKNYVYVSEDSSLPFWKEIPKQSKSIELILKEDTRWGEYLEMTSVLSNSLYIPASVQSKQAAGLDLSSGVWLSDDMPLGCAISTLLAEKNGLSIGNSLAGHPYPLAPSRYRGEDQDAPLADIFISLNNLVQSAGWPLRNDPVKLTIVGIYNIGEDAPAWVQGGNAVILR